MLRLVSDSCLCNPASQLRDTISQSLASENSHRAHLQAVQAQLTAAQGTLAQLASDKAVADARVAELYAEAAAARAQALGAGTSSAAQAADAGGWTPHQKQL